MKESQTQEKKKKKSGTSGWAKWNAQRESHALELQKAKDKGKRSSGRVIQTGVKRAEWPTVRHIEVQTDDSETEWIYIDRKTFNGLEESQHGIYATESQEDGKLDFGGLEQSQ